MNYYRNYGNRRGQYDVRTKSSCDKNCATNNVCDCGCQKPEVKPGYDCGCQKPEVKPGYDCECSCECDCRKSDVGAAEDCGCVEEMKGMPIGMTYVPWQCFQKLYEVCEGFNKGTIFRELDFDFLGRRCN